MARLYELASAIDGLKPKNAADKWAKREALEIFVRLTGPMTPHLAEELWQSLGHKSLLADSPWPLAEDTLLVDDTVTVAVQLNGKLRGTLQLAKDIAKDEAEKARITLDRIPWPLAEDTLLVDDTVTVAVQLNGKLRGTLQLAKDVAKDEAEKAALALPELARGLNGKTPKRVIVVPNRIVNVVV